MAGLALRLRSWFRARRVVVLVTAVVVGAVAGLAFGLVAGTRRTATAPDRYTTWSGGDPDLLVQQQSGDPLFREVGALPGVKDATGVTFVTAFLRGPDGKLVFRPNPFAGDDRVAGFRVIEGRATDPHEPDEFTVSPTMAEILRRRYDAHVGDTFAVSAFSRDQVETNRAFSSGERPKVPEFRARWVGIVDSPSNFEEDSPAIYYSKAFLAAHPTVGVVQTLLQVRLEPGVDPQQVLRAIRELPDGGDAYTVSSRIVSESSRRAVRFQVTALWIVSGIVAVGAIVVVMLLVGRIVRRPEHEARALAALGVRSRDLAFERVCEALGCIAIGIPVAVLVSAPIAGRFPLGGLRVFEPDPGARVDWTIVGLGLVVLVLAATLGAVFAASRAGGDRGRAGARSRPVLPARGAMPFAVGAHFARVGPAGRRRSLLSLAAGVLGMAGLVAAVVVGLSVDAMVHHEQRWGVNYDALLGNPYVESPTDIASPVTRTHGVAQLTAAHIGSLSIDGVETSTLAVDPVKGDLLPEVLRGRAPRRGIEIGLGAEVADRLGVDVGGTVTLEGSDGETRPARVVGIVVTPDSAGGGAAVPFALYRTLNRDATRNILLVDFTPGAREQTVRRLQAQNFSPPDALPVPTSVAALDRVLPAPVVLAIVLSVLLLVGCTFLLTLSVRAQRRDFAILRALGARRRQLRSVVHWETTLIVLAVLAVGVPIGILVGRLIVRELTDRLGIVPGVVFPVVSLFTGALAALAIANLLAILPARRAAQPRPTLLTQD